MLSASIGIALYPDHATELQELQELADRAMYVAKARGRNQAVVFSRDVETREVFVQEIARDLSQAVARGQMKLHFQPLIHRNGTLTGFEALLRWEHPVHGPIPPLDFIPVAEKSGYMSVLGDWVMEEACRECLGWNQRGFKLGVAVNVSAAQFNNVNFAGQVIRTINRLGLDPALLTLELTESMLVQDRGKTSHELAALRRFGVRVALDDFGTGYSSLSYLTTIPADIIKLDRSFLKRETDAETAVVESIIELAHRIGLSVVGEGIETLRQSDHLRSLGCDEMQGFYFSHPIASDKVDAYLNENSDAMSVPEDGIEKFDGVAVDA